MGVSAVNTYDDPSEKSLTLVSFSEDRESENIFSQFGLALIKQISQSEHFSDANINFIHQSILLIKEQHQGENQINVNKFLEFLKKGRISDNQILSLLLEIRDSKYQEEKKLTIINLVRTSDGNRGKLYGIVFSEKMKHNFPNDVLSFVKGVLFHPLFGEGIIGNIILGIEENLEAITSKKDFQLYNLIDYLFKKGHFDFTHKNKILSIIMDSQERENISKLIDSYNEQSIDNLTETIKTNSSSLLKDYDIGELIKQDVFRLTREGRAKKLILTPGLGITSYSGTFGVGMLRVIIEYGLKKVVANICEECKKSDKELQKITETLNELKNSKNILRNAIVIAEAIYPVEGENSKFNSFIEQSTNGIDGGNDNIHIKVDLMDRGAIYLIEAGGILGSLSEHKKGKDGLDLNGRVIKSKPVVSQESYIGKNVSLFRIQFPFNDRTITLTGKDENQEEVTRKISDISTIRKILMGNTLTYLNKSTKNKFVIKDLTDVALYRGKIIIYYKDKENREKACSLSNIIDVEDKDFIVALYYGTPEYDEKKGKISVSRKILLNEINARVGNQIFKLEDEKNNKKTPLDIEVKGDIKPIRVKIHCNNLKVLGDIDDVDIIEVDKNLEVGKSLIKGIKIIVGGKVSIKKDLRSSKLKAPEIGVNGVVSDSILCADNITIGEKNPVRKCLFGSTLIGKEINITGSIGGSELDKNKFVFDNSKYTTLIEEYESFSKLYGEKYEGIIKGIEKLRGEIEDCGEDFEKRERLNKKLKNQEKIEKAFQTKKEYLELKLKEMEKDVMKIYIAPQGQIHGDCELLLKTGNYDYYESFGFINKSKLLKGLTIFAKYYKDEKKVVLKQTTSGNRKKSITFV